LGLGMKSLQISGYDSHLRKETFRMGDSFMSALGLEVEVLAPGQARTRATVRPEHLNSMGMAHGGFLYTMADTAFAFASNSRGVPAVAISTHMDYLQAGYAGDHLEATASEVYLGYRTGVYRAEVRNGATLLAIFTGTVYRKQGKQEASAEEK
jgi:acyl-CoA thioesterase